MPRNAHVLPAPGPSLPRNGHVLPAPGLSARLTDARSLAPSLILNCKTASEPSDEPVGGRYGLTVQWLHWKGLEDLQSWEGMLSCAHYDLHRFIYLLESGRRLKRLRVRQPSCKRHLSRPENCRTEPGALWWAEDAHRSRAATGLINYQIGGREESSQGPRAQRTQPCN